jgi:hypothetical protein
MASVSQRRMRSPFGLTLSFLSIYNLPPCTRWIFRHSPTLTVLNVVRVGPRRKTLLPPPSLPSPTHTSFDPAHPVHDQYTYPDGTCSGRWSMQVLRKEGDTKGRGKAEREEGKGKRVPWERWLRTPDIAAGRISIQLAHFFSQ